MIAGGQRGSALVAALGILSAMTLLATMALLAGGTDLAISTRQARQRSVFYAAESALETTLTELASESPPIPEATFLAPWPPPGTAVKSWQDGAWTCSRRICLIPDPGDADGDPATTVVLFNRAFGRGDSPLASGGFPVFQVLVSAQGGGSRQAIAAEVAPVTCAPRITAAWTAAGALTLSGDLRVDGAAGLAAVKARSPVALLDGAAIDGESVSDPQLALPADLLEILNAGGTLQRLDELPEPPASGALRGQFWSRGDYSVPTSGEGILVVHNPSFDPVKYEASRRSLEEGVFAEGWDPEYSHLDAARRPARLEILGGGTFSGLIVADEIGGPMASFTLSGALVTLTRSPMTVAASVALRVSGSRDELARSGRGELRVVTAFRPLSEAPEQLGPCP